MPQNIDERTFEQSVAELAVNTLKSKVPALMDYALAFQLVERSDDDTRAIGFFGFRVGKTLLYIPIFFLSGDIKGVELCYVVDEDRFVPLTEDWVNQLIKRKTFTIGSEAGKDRKRQGISGPDLRRLRVPPMEAKISADLSYNGYADWASFGPKMFDTALRVTEKIAVADLPDVVARAGITEQFLRNAQAEPKLANAVFTFFSPEDFLVAMERHCKTAAAVDTIPSGTSGGSVRVFTADDAIRTPEDLGFLEPEEKKKVLKGEIVIKDTRGESQKREVYDVDLTKKLFNPSEGGIYDVLAEDGGIARLAVLQPKLVGTGGTRDIRLVLNAKGEHSYAFKSGIWCTAKLERTENLEAISDFGEALESKDTWTDDRDDGVFSGHEGYVLISPDGAYAIGPFRVEKTLENVDGTTSLFVRQITPAIDGHGDIVNAGLSKDRSGLPFDGVLFSDDGVVNLNDGGQRNNHPGTNNNYGAERNYPTGAWESMRRVILTDKPIRNPVVSNGIVMVPRVGGFRVVKLTQKLDVSSSPGTSADIYMGISKFADALDITYDGQITRIALNGVLTPVYTTKAAYEHLCGTIGLRAEDAIEVVKISRDTPKRTHKVLVGHRKVAAPFDQPDFDAHQDPVLGAPVQQGGISTMNLLPEGASFDPGASQTYRHFKDENNYSAVYGSDIDNMNSATKAGQKDVFNASAISALANVGDVSGEIEEYLPALMKALDKLGRTLFLFYWHGEEIQERYGKTEARSLEDDVSNLFENLGDTIVKLKKNAPNSDDLFGSGIIGGAGSGQTAN